MTKEEFIRNAIKNRKEDDELAMCCGVNCDDCPYAGLECHVDVVYGLLDYIIELEKHKETNLEHYSSDYNSHDECIYMDAVKLMNEPHRRLNNFDEAIERLLEPYKEPKPKYKLSKFEYDLLQTAKWSTHLFGEYDYLMNLKAIGYFQDITSAMAIVNVLDNAEVIEE